MDRDRLIAAKARAIVTLDVESGTIEPVCDLERDHPGCRSNDGRADPQTLGRVSIYGTAEMIENGEAGYTPLKKAYLDRFPEAEQLFKLDDFNFWRIKPKGGRFVAGFAKAFNITVETLQKVSER